MPKNIMAAAKGFGHLIGLNKAETEEDTKPKDDENSSEEEDEDQKPKDDKDEAGKKAAEGEDDPKKKDDEEASEEDEDDKKPKEDGKKASEEDEDDSDEDDEDKESDDTKAERARGRKIFQSAAAGKRPDLAAHFAFETALSAKQAIQSLEVAVQGQADVQPQNALANRMAQLNTPNITPSATQSGNDKMNAANSIIAALNKSKGKG